MVPIRSCYGASKPTLKVTSSNLKIRVFNLNSRTRLLSSTRSPDLWHSSKFYQSDSDGLPPFALERWSGWDGAHPSRILCNSEVEPLFLRELLELVQQGGPRQDDLQRDWEEMWLGYSPQQGCEKLRREVIQSETGTSMSMFTNFSPDEITISSPGEAIL